MKKLRVIFFIFSSLTWTACSREKENSAIVSKHTDKFPIETVRQYSFPRELNFSLDSVEIQKLKPIDSIFFKRWFEDKKVNNIDYKIEFDRYSRYYYFDFKDLDNKFLFSIIHDDEVGYDNLFHFTVDKRSSSIAQVDFVAATGGDGGHGNIDRFKYSRAGDLLTLTSISTFDEDILNNNLYLGYTTKYDSIVSQIKFNLDNTRYTLIDSFSRLDTIHKK